MVYYTNIIFKNRKIQFDSSDNENHKVLASDHIKAGEILLIEHLASNHSSTKIMSYVKHNKELFDNLYPRTRSYGYEDRINKEDEVEKLAHEKVQKDVFRVENNNGEEYYAIGIHVSKFNHKIIPNTYINIKNIGDKNKQLCFMSITASQDIQIGSEININYGKGYFDEKESVEMPQSADESNTVKNILNRYMNKPAFHQVYDNLALADCEFVYHYDDENMFVAKCPK